LPFLFIDKFQIKLGIEMQSISFDRLQPYEIDALVSDPKGFGNLKFDEEDSPVSIDSMLSVQNGKLMFVSSVKIGTLVGLLETEDPRLSLDQRRQRKPDHRRIPGMSEYIHGTPWAYSAITVALSGAFKFTPTKRPDGSLSRLGVLKIPRGFKTRSVIIDGQHRFLSLRASLGLEANYSRYALPYEKQQILADENMAVIFYVFKSDQDGVDWSQQYFHDLNCLGVQTSRSLGIKFDKRTPINRLAVHLAERALPFVGRIEFEMNQCGPRNTNLFTLSALKNANKYLLEEVVDENLTEKYDIALKYWNAIGEIFQEWTEMHGYEVRNTYIHGYGVILSSLGLLGRYLIDKQSEDYKDFLLRLKGLDWSKWLLRPDGTVQTTEDGKKVGNPFWNGFGMSGSTVQNTTTNIKHTTMLFRQTLGLRLNEDEETEMHLLRSNLTS
jgi:DNA sulfur modification protein DndB